MVPLGSYFLKWLCSYSVNTGAVELHMFRADYFFDLPVNCCLVADSFTARKIAVTGTVQYFYASS
mgnify:CR=1 FL=1